MVSTMLGVMVAINLGVGWAPAVWHNDYARACAEAHGSDKPLFIVICPAASEYRQMASLGVFLSDGLEKTLQSDYVRLFIDTDSVSGKELAQRFEATDEAPHFVILDRTGRWQVYYKTGYLLEEDLAPVLKQFRRTKLAANGLPIREIVRQPVAQVCST